MVKSNILFLNDVEKIDIMNDDVYKVHKSRGGVIVHLAILYRFA